MTPAELRARLQMASEAQPVLKKLLRGNFDRADLEPLARATAMLGLFDLSFALRALQTDATPQALQGLCSRLFAVTADDLDELRGLVDFASVVRKFF